MSRQEKKIFIIEDEIVVAKDLEYILASNNFYVLGIATNYQMAKNKLLSLKPDLILCDINLNGPKTGIDLMHEMQQKYNIPFIFITAYTDKDTIEKASKLNPLNYITKPFNEKQLMSSITIALLDGLKTEQPTAREVIILKHLSKGNSSKEIAASLNISFNTVETHRKNLMKKYQVRSVAELTCMATSKGWISYEANASR